MSNLKIALVGASSTGKSTVFEVLKQSLIGYRYINESTRTVANYGFPINENGTDLTQLAISSFHLEALLTTSNTIYDRCYLDLVVYTRHMATVSSAVKQYVEDTWKRVAHRYNCFFYFPIEFNSVEDGVRSVNETWRQAIDQEFQSALRELPNVYVVSGNLETRIQTIKESLEQYLSTSKQGRGRPRKHPVFTSDVPKRRPGRPKVKPDPDPNIVKRRPGRPKSEARSGSDTLHTSAEGALDAAGEIDKQRIQDAFNRLISNK